MTEPMSFDRFRQLADAYGGTIARWPERERASAQALLGHTAARQVLADAAAIDARLDGWRSAMPSAALTGRIVAAAAPQGWGWYGRARLWWSGLGLATALAGAAAGSLAAAALTPAPVTVEGATAFGDVSAGDAS